MSLIRSRAVFVALVLALAVVGAANYFAMKQAPGPVDVEGGYIEVGYAFNVADEKQIVGFADNVFVGRVVEKLGADNPTFVGREGQVVSSSVSTQFSVEVLENIKGELRGTVTVSQPGGVVEYTASEDFPEKGIEKGQRVRELQLVEEDPLLEPGQEVLFITGYEREKDRHEIVANRFADLRIKDEKDRAEKVKKFEDAKNNSVDPRRGK